MKATINLLDPAPFVEWYDREAVLHGHDAVCVRLGWNPDSGARKLSRWRVSGVMCEDALGLLDACQMAGVDFITLFDGHFRANGLLTAAETRSHVGVLRGNQCRWDAHYEHIRAQLLDEGPPEPTRPPVNADSALLEALYRERAEWLLRVTHRKINATDALIEDACATAWTRLAERPAVLRDPRAPGWLITVAYNECLALLKHASEVSREPLPDVAHRTGVEDVVEARELLRAIDELAPRQREVLGALANGCSYAQIATGTGRSYTAVNKAIVKGRRQLRRRLQTSDCRPNIEPQRSVVIVKVQPKPKSAAGRPPVFKPGEFGDFLDRTIMEFDQEIAKLRAARAAIIKGARKANGRPASPRGS